MLAVICAVVGAGPAGFCPIAAACSPEEPAGSGTVGAPREKFAGAAAWGLEFGGTSGASMRTPPETFALVASSIGIPLLLNQAFRLTLSTLSVNVGEEANRNAP